MEKTVTFTLRPTFVIPRFPPPFQFRQLPSIWRNMSTQKTNHIERTASEPRARELLDTRLAWIEQVNSQVRLFRLELTSGPANFLPGQWLDTFVPNTPKAGGFTITSPPSSAARPSNSGTAPYFELAVQESPGNAPAAWLWRPEEEILGSNVKVRIGGSFVFPPGRNARDLKKVIFVAGGVGVNPLMSMLSYIGDHYDDFEGLQVHMLYASKIPQKGMDGIVFLDRITRLYGEERIRGSVSLHVTQSDSALGGVRAMNGVEVNVYPRRISIDDINRLIGDAEERKSTVAYICGPPTMTDQFVADLTSKNGPNLEAGQVLTEKWW